MHELSLAVAIINSVEKMFKQRKWKKINRVTVRIGRLRQVEHEVFAFAFTSAAEGTPLQGAALSIMEVPVVFKCHQCGSTCTSEDVRFVCPNCGSSDVDITSGLDMFIDSVEIEA